MKILLEMGHCDEFVLADGIFPVVTRARRLVQCDGLGIPVLLDAVLEFLPLDHKIKAPVSLMAPGADDTFVSITREEHSQIVWKHQVVNNKFEYLEHLAFYARAKQAHAVVANSEPALAGISF